MIEAMNSPNQYYFTTRPHHKLPGYKPCTTYVDQAHQCEISHSSKKLFENTRPIEIIQSYIFLQVTKIAHILTKSLPQHKF